MTTPSKVSDTRHDRKEEDSGTKGEGHDEDPTNESSIINEDVVDGSSSAKPTSLPSAKNPIDNNNNDKNGTRHQGVEKEVFSKSPAPAPSSWRATMSCRLGVHLLCVGLYTWPLLRHLDELHPSVLDESHFSENGDILGTTTWAELLQNDYWGRPILTFASSHKSWRPLAVSLFRLTHLHSVKYPIVYHRWVGAVLHAATADLVGTLACQLFSSFRGKDAVSSSSSFSWMLLHSVTKLLFAFHPSHVEAVANAANHVHVMAVLASLLASDSRIPLELLALSLIGGLLCCETAIFQYPAIMMTTTVLEWRRRTTSLTTKAPTVRSPSNSDDDPTNKTRFWETPLISTITHLIPRYIIIVGVGVGYFLLRHAYDTLSIPDGLIRPAENPFYNFVGWDRVLSYALVFSIHVSKSLFLDPIGFSHEYGFDCLEAVSSESWKSDMRLILPLTLAVIVAGTVVTIVWPVIVPPPTNHNKRRDMEPLLLLAVALSWGLVTLFPVSGIVKVGTFIADRICMPSTVATALFGGRFLAGWLSSGQRHYRPFKAVMLLIGLVVMGRKVVVRSTQWMSPRSLLESSLETCPNSAKSNLEISKIYTGMYPDLVDYDKARLYLERAEQIDPNYCDVHSNFLQILMQENNIEEFEERLTKAVLCPFTMGGSQHTFQQYWSIVTDTERNSEKLAARAKERYQKQMAIIQKRVWEEQKKEEMVGSERRSRSPLTIMQPRHAVSEEL